MASQCDEVECDKNYFDSNNNANDGCEDGPKYCTPDDCGPSQVFCPTSPPKCVSDCKDCPDFKRPPNEKNCEITCRRSVLPPPGLLC